jgi:hypothetical protein
MFQLLNIGSMNKSGFQCKNQSKRPTKSFVQAPKLLQLHPTYSQGGVEIPTGGIPGCAGEPASAPFVVKGGQQIW